MSSRIIYSFGVCLFIISNSIAQVSFTASTDASKIATGSSVNVTFTLENAEGKSFNPPKLDGLEIIAGPSTQRSSSWVNGKTSSSISYTYTLLAEKKGKYEIGSATIVVDGKRMKSNPLTIEVVKGKSVDKLQFKNNYVQIEVSDSTVVIGQQIVLDYVLYFQQDLSGYDIENEDFKYEGFFSQNINSKDRTTRRTIINGEEYYVKTLESVTLFPQRTGVYQIDDVTVTLSVPIPGQRRRGFFSNVPTRKQRIRTNSLKIYVEELPKPIPEYYSGAVGKYKMQSSIQKRNITTDDAILMHMEIRGNGDGKTVRAPLQPPLSDMEYYDPNIIEDKNINDIGSIDNYKKIEYLLVPKKAGSHIIIPEFTYYDTDSNSYVTLTSDPIRVNVNQGNRKITTDNREITTGQKLSPAKQSTEMIRRFQLNYWDRVLNVCFVIFALLLSGIIWKKRQLDKEGNIDPIEKRRRVALELAEAQLSKAKEYMKDNKTRAFYSEVSSAMNGFLGDKYQIPHKDFNKSLITIHLKNNDVELSYIERYLSILKQCEMAIFAGQSESNMLEVYKNSISLIKDLESKHV